MRIWGAAFCLTIITWLIAKVMITNMDSADLHVRGGLVMWIIGIHYSSHAGSVLKLTFYSALLCTAVMAIVTHLCVHIYLTFRSKR